MIWASPDGLHSEAAWHISVHHRRERVLESGSWCFLFTCSLGVDFPTGCLFCLSPLWLPGLKLLKQPDQLQALGSPASSAGSQPPHSRWKEASLVWLFPISASFYCSYSFMTRIVPRSDGWRGSECHLAPFPPRSWESVLLWVCVRVSLCPLSPFFRIEISR